MLFFNFDYRCHVADMSNTFTRVGVRNLTVTILDRILCCLYFFLALQFVIVQAFSRAKTIGSGLKNRKKKLLERIMGFFLRPQHV